MIEIKTKVTRYETVEVSDKAVQDYLIQLPAIDAVIFLKCCIVALSDEELKRTTDAAKGRGFPFVTVQLSLLGTAEQMEKCAKRIREICGEGVQTFEDPSQ